MSFRANENASHYLLFGTELDTEQYLSRYRVQYCSVLDNVAASYWSLDDKMCWGNHMICNKRFHFVLPSKELAFEEAESFIIEVNGIDSQNSTMSTKQRMEIENHLMHGVLHLNGFGHLICINGFEGGSEFVSGHQIMDLWDRICTSLQVRQISLIDVATKGGMELRIINGLAYGEPWFERWGYKFGHGSYGITEQMYQRSLQALRAFPLALLLPPLYHTIFDVDILTITTKYQSTTSEVLKSLGDLFHCMMELKAKLSHEISPTTTAMEFHSIMKVASCRWSVKRVEMAAQVIVQELRRSENRWVSRQEVRDAARAYIGDTGLLDYVLKHLGNHIIDFCSYEINFRRLGKSYDPATAISIVVRNLLGYSICRRARSSSSLRFYLKILKNTDIILIFDPGNYIVRRTVNPITKVLEYCLQDISSPFPYILTASASNTHQNNPTRFQITRLQLNEDILYLYKQILIMAEQPHPISTSPVSSAFPVAVNILLDTKHLIKDYNMNFSQPTNIDPEHIKLTCVARLRGHLHTELQPKEILRIPTNLTIGDLKRVAERYYKSTYFGLRNFVADAVMLENANASGGEDCEGDLVAGLVEITNGGVVVVEGSGNCVDGEIMFECGNGEEVVDCLCGAKEEDGERMVSCDICEVWQHRRCVRIQNGDEVPYVFLCGRCESQIVKLPLMQY
ncbi:PHD finger protein PERSISTENT TAPETAL CELL 1 [Dendrobium catenatum]|uniref:PHD finger protein PERSISTENT TAPETAL CELL 1 n=1 Tax=Dendrobium catenatum TaxID=906689 RepID=UPI00109F80DA|nr:PHD finger protein PERSISTENT TAPETAL CELL 1 [Dendrobium catenatum]